MQHCSCTCCKGYDFPQNHEVCCSFKIYKSSAIVGEVADGILPKSVFVLLLGFSVLDMLLRILGVLYRFTHSNWFQYLANKIIECVFVHLWQITFLIFLKFYFQEKEILYLVICNPNSFISEDSAFTYT